MGDKNRAGKTIRLREDTITRINSMKARGQTYDGFIATVLDSWEQTERAQAADIIKKNSK